MKKTMKSAFFCYVLVCLAFFFVGIVYFFSPRIMPYHEEVIGTKWESVAPRYQEMFLSLLHGVGATMVSICIAGLSILILPFRKGEKWAKWALPSIFLPSNLFLIYITLYLHVTYNVATPWVLCVAVLALIVAGFILSMIKIKSD
jgi:hypothetical protein